MTFITNPQLDLAFDYVRNTDKNIFLTGKAGTGKTTFLHQIKKEGIKRMAIVAPTGVAAINAGGMTIHSFFQMPFGLLLPGKNAERSKQRKFSSKKISLIQSLDLLVIDEISMVRADLLDGIDEVLRRYKDPAMPFGGVQLLMIGDLHQLPPVVKQDEWMLMRDHYDTPYFFGSLALQKSDPITIQLTHIFRQSDGVFIDLLNKVRDNRIDQSVLETLNSRFQPHFSPNENDGYITLTSHNASAQEINAEKLAEIDAPLHQFRATIKGDFPRHAYPTEEVLEFKVGAQVMFVKNDPNPEKLYYNGKIGKITGIKEDEILVRCPDMSEDISVAVSEWKNMKYSLDEKSKEVQEDEIGAFIQYPLKLAWAITIHKSQGLTFEKAIIDAQAAFAHGQVYVALSRCKSFEGIVLRSPIQFSSVKTDSVVQRYSEEAERNAPNEEQLARDKKSYQEALLLGLFDFKKTRNNFSQALRAFLEHKYSFQGSPVQALKKVQAEAEEHVFSVAEKFIPQLLNYFSQLAMPSENIGLLQRLTKASNYFTEKIEKELMPKLEAVPILSDNKAVKKNAEERMEKIKKSFFVKNACFAFCKNGFDSQGLIRARNDAAIDFTVKKSKDSANARPSFLPKDMEHRELFFQLSKWRADIAAESGLELYQVLPTKSLFDLVKYLPTDSASLKRIKGIGEYKVKAFGASLIEVIEDYCKANKVQGNLLASVPIPPPPPPKKDTKLISLELFEAGKSIAEIAEERGFAVGTIEGHLAHFVSAGRLEVTRFLDSKDVELITEYFKAHETTSTSEAKEFFQEKYSYGELKMVLAHLKREHQ